MGGAAGGMDAVAERPGSWQLAADSHLTMLKCSAGMFKIKALRLATKVALTMGGQACDAYKWVPAGQDPTMKVLQAFAKEWQRNCNGILECDAGRQSYATAQQLRALHCCRQRVPIGCMGHGGCDAVGLGCPCPCSTSWQSHRGMPSRAEPNRADVSHFEDLLRDKLKN